MGWSKALKEDLERMDSKMKFKKGDKVFVDGTFCSNLNQSEVIIAVSDIAGKKLVVVKESSIRRRLK